MGTGSLAQALCSQALHLQGPHSVVVRVWVPEPDGLGLFLSLTYQLLPAGCPKIFICKTGLVIAPTSGLLEGFHELVHLKG